MDEAPTHLDDPTATYKGFRRQALYCLSRLFDDGLPQDIVIQPEGNEDLAIYDAEDKLIEVVQVKDHGSNLAASSFKPSFYERISNLCRENSAVKVKIVSFGSIGSELVRACDNTQSTPKRAISTLTKEREVTRNGNKIMVPGLREDDAKEVFSRLSLVEVSEDTLTDQLNKKLTATLTSGNHEVAFDNLMWWLTLSAESQKRLSRDVTIKKIEELGKFLADRGAHANEWNVSIKPIQIAKVDDDRKKKLKSEFFQGGHVRTEHVAADLDVPRYDVMHSIHEAFRKERVVILRGASGQGKTTLAYRYLLDSTPADFRFQVEQAADLAHARQMATAIMGHSEALEVPSVIYIDVRPGDNLWVEFVRTLAGTKGIRILVTIREEDWFRCRVTKDQFAFIDLPMTFNEETGENLFKQLRSNSNGNEYLNFNDAWSKLGHRKTLFEFVYLVTQDEHLADKVRAQVSLLKGEVNAGSLKPEELQLLRLVAVASAYEARLGLKKLVRHLSIPEPTQALGRYKNEYLLRTSDGRFVEGFHSIRSEIIASELTDEVLQPRGDIEASLVPMVVEEDLESFLLSSFLYSFGASQAVLSSIQSTRFESWVGLRAVLVATQWLGLKQYAEANAGLIDEVREDSVRKGWWIILDWDLSQVSGTSSSYIFHALGLSNKAFEDAAGTAERFRSRQTDKKSVFLDVSEWMQIFQLPKNTPNTVDQYMAMAEVLYWLGHLGLSNNHITNWVDHSVISRAWEILPDHLFGLFAAGINNYLPVTYSDWIDSNREQVVSRLRSSAAIITMVEQGESLVAHYLIDHDQEASALKPKKDEETSINELSMQRLDVISSMLPGFSEYGAIGYGHRMSFFESYPDESLKRINVDQIRKPWLTEFNGLARGLVEYRFRTDSWDE